jgi:hypothetical protein
MQVENSRVTQDWPTDHPHAADLGSSAIAHLPEMDINEDGTIYHIGQDNQFHGHPSLSVYNSWHIPGDFTKVVLANAANLALPVGSVPGMRDMANQ